MSAPFPVNNKIPPGYKRPGVFVSYEIGDTGESRPNHRVLLFGYVPAGAAITLNTPTKVLVKSQVDALTGSPKSMLSRMYASAKSTLPNGVGAEFHLVALAEPSGGAKAKRLIKFMAKASAGTLGSNTSAAQGTVCTVLVGMRGASFVIAQGDTFAQIATKAKAALDLVENLPVVVTISGGDTLELEDIHAGEAGNDMPISVTFDSDEAGVAASCGTLTIGGGPAAANGVLTVKATVKSAAIAYLSADTATVIATKAVTALNGDAYSVSAAQAAVATPVVTLFYRSARVLNRLSAAAVGGGITATLAAGVQGVGTPTITSAIAALSADTQAYKSIVPFWTDSSNAGTLAAAVISQDQSPIEKDQRVFFGTSLSLVDSQAANLADATSPKLTTSALFAVMQEPGSTVPAYEQAARVGAIVAAEDYQARNFNGRALTGNEYAPLGAPHRADRQTPDEENLSITALFLAPIGVNEDDEVVIVRSSTTYKAKGSLDQKLEKWSAMLQVHLYRNEIKAEFRRLFREKSIKRYGEPRTDASVSAQDVKDAVYRLMLEWDDRDLFDGAQQLRDAIQAGVVVSPTRIDVSLPFRPLADLDQLAVQGIIS